MAGPQPSAVGEPAVFYLRRKRTNGHFARKENYTIQFGGVDHSVAKKQTNINPPSLTTWILLKEEEKNIYGGKCL